MTLRAYRLALALVVALTMFAACSGRQAPEPATPVASARPATTQPSTAPVPSTTQAAVALVSPTPSATLTPLPAVTSPPAMTPRLAVTATVTPTAVRTLAPAGAALPSSTLTVTAKVLPVTPTVTATIAATSGVTLSEQLTAGKWLQSIGDCQSARREFAALVERGSPGSAEVAEARLRLAQCYLLDDAPAEAVGVLNDLLAGAAPNDPSRSPATFLLGDAYAAIGLWAKAEASYTQHLTSEPGLAPFTWQRIAAARSGAQNLAGAAEAYNKALTGSPDWSNTVAIRRGLAGVLEQLGNPRAAALQYDALRGDAFQGKWAAEMQWLAGSALLRAGDRAGAFERWRAAAAADPTSQYAHSAMAALVDADAPVDEYLRGVVDYQNDSYQLAIDAFERLRAVEPGGHQGEAWYYEGLSYQALDRYDRALVELSNFIAAHPESPLWADAWLAKGQVQAQAGDTAGAIATYRQLAKEHPASKQAPTALYRAATLQAAGGDRAAAMQTYLELGHRYPEDDLGWQAYMAAGLAQFRAGDYGQAGQIWAEMAEQAKMPGWTRPVAYYWLGQAQAAAGESEAARQSWQRATESGVDGYYTQRAASRLAGDGAVLFPPGSTSFPTASALAVDTDALAGWLRSWAGPGSLALSPAIQADPDWQRGRQLLAIGLRSSGLAAWNRLQSRFAADPWAMTALALAFRDAGEHPMSIAAAERVAELAAQASQQQLPAALERLIYPLPFAQLIANEAQRWNVDPLLVAALMRQESRFEAGATSTAVAQGLMQIIPDTAQWIELQLGWQGASNQIYRPYVNVHFGTFYLRKQLDAFNNNAAAALAAYNGGPGNARRWRDQVPTDDDLMVALINLPESRLYVQLVWQNYEAYRRLYPR